MATPGSTPIRTSGGWASGFTLVELLLILSVLGVLGLLAVPRFTGSQQTARVNVDDATIALIDLQWETKRVTSGAYGTLAALLADPVFPDGAPVCPRTPYADGDNDNRVDAHAHQTPLTSRRPRPRPATRAGRRVRGPCYRPRRWPRGRTSG
jgi:type II secretory pathway pseudopilin PulG